MRIGIYGGSFDPIHLGHIQVAETVMRSGLIDKIIFLPTYNTEYKQLHTSFQDRCIMVNIAISDRDDFSLSDSERYIYQKKINQDNWNPYVYTIDVIKHFNEKYPDDQFSFILGSDSWANIKSWHQYNELLKITNFIVVERYNTNIKVEHSDNVTFLPIENQLNISSTKIRELIKYINPKILAYYLMSIGD